MLGGHLGHGAIVLSRRRQQRRIALGQRLLARDARRRHGRVEIGKQRRERRDALLVRALQRCLFFRRTPHARPPHCLVVCAERAPRGRRRRQ